MLIAFAKQSWPFGPNKEKMTTTTIVLSELVEAKTKGEILGDSNLELRCILSICRLPFCLAH